MKTRKPGFERGQFFAEVSGPRPRALLPDYHGALAPFHIERDQAAPHPELRKALERIIQAGRSRMVVITGRAFRDLISLLGLEPPAELWACHGWERILPEGECQGPEREATGTRALKQAHPWACSAGGNDRCQAKPASVAVHWRGLDTDSRERLRARVCAARDRPARSARLELHEFDGGSNGAQTVATVLRELEDDVIAAYAGDDRTDEDAFRALSDRGLSILVRPEYHKTAADPWLQVPHETARPLEAWTAAETDMEGGSV